MPWCMLSAYNTMLIDGIILELEFRIKNCRGQLMITQIWVTTFGV